MDTSAPTGFMAWIQTNGQLVLFFAQIVYWLVVCVAAIWATLIFRSYVAFKTASPDAASAAQGSTTTAPSAEGPVTSTASDISVDEFVD